MRPQMLKLTKTKDTGERSTLISARVTKRPIVLKTIDQKTDGRSRNGLEVDGNFANLKMCCEICSMRQVVGMRVSKHEKWAQCQR